MMPFGVQKAPHHLERSILYPKDNGNPQGTLPLGSMWGPCTQCSEISISDCQPLSSPQREGGCSVVTAGASICSGGRRKIPGVCVEAVFVSLPLKLSTKSSSHPESLGAHLGFLGSEKPLPLAHSGRFHPRGLCPGAAIQATPWSPRPDCGESGTPVAAAGWPPWHHPFAP